MDVNLEYYKIFYYVGKAGSISGAAEILSISQPAVSQAIKHLENCLGSALFIRTSRGVRLTGEGETFYRYIERGYEYMKLGEEQLSYMRNLDTGEIRIGASDMTLKYYLLPFLEQFHEKYPRIKIHVTNAPTPTTLKYLQEGKIDFGVVSTPFEERQGLLVQQVRKIEDIFVAGEKFLAMQGRKLHYKELEKLPVLCLETDTSTRRYVDQFLKENGVLLNPEFELSTSDILVQFALRNLGIACVTRDFAAQYLESGEIFQLKFTKGIPKRHFCIVTDNRFPCSNAAAKLLEYCKDNTGKTVF